MSTPNITPCKRCKAQILWAKTERGKNMPLDAKPHRLWTVGEDGVCREVVAYQTHWATCPNAADFKTPTTPPTKETPDATVPQ